MTKAEVNKILRRLEAIFPNGFRSEEMKAEYADTFRDLDYTSLDRTITKIKLEGVQREDGSINKTFMPTIAEIYGMYKQFEKKTIVHQHNEKYCDVCDNKGFELIWKESDGNKYVYAYYCPYCAAGQQYAYDGRQCADRERRSPYFTLPLTAVLTQYEIEQLRKANANKKRLYAEDAQETQEAFKKIGRDIPPIKVYAEDYVEE
jgi:hypothetical protein